MPSYLIVGAGMFGASTALFLKRADPTATVIVLDRSAHYPSASAAVHDVNKIIRSEYVDIRYMKLALEAMTIWRTDPDYTPFWFNTGVLWSAPQARIDAYIQNYVELLGQSPAMILDREEVLGKFDGVFRDGDFHFSEDEVWLYNPNGGWGETAGALRRTMEIAVGLGVEYANQTAEVLVFDGPKCTGVKTRDGKTYTADRVLLCTGAYTAKLLADSAPSWRELQLGNRMVTAAACMGLQTISESDAEKFKEAPVICHHKYPFPGAWASSSPIFRSHPR
jgi:sarcosine oxidase / L-pipecolate oxidase